MSATNGPEPATDAEMAAWIGAAMRDVDRFSAVRESSDAHRLVHGCELYPSAEGPLLGVLARASNALRAIELGCGLGYSALWLASGLGDSGIVDTVEVDSSHVELAMGFVRDAGMAGRVRVLTGASIDILPSLSVPYDLAFFDGDLDDCLQDLDQLERLVRPGGLLISSNLFLGRYVPDAPWLEKATEYRLRLLDSGVWQTAFLPGGKALSVRL